MLSYNSANLSKIYFVSYDFILKTNIKLMQSENPELQNQSNLNSFIFGVLLLESIILMIILGIEKPFNYGTEYKSTTYITIFFTFVFFVIYWGCYRFI